MAYPSISMSCFSLEASLGAWQVEQTEEFRQMVEQYTDAEPVVLADAYQVLLRYGPLPHPGSPLEIHRQTNTGLKWIERIGQ